MSRWNYQLPTPGTGPLMDGEQLSIGGATVFRQTVEACIVQALISANFTRPADTAVYAAGDAITNSTSAPVALTFASMARFNGGAGKIRSAWLIDSGNQATKLSAELWLFRGAAAPTPDNDNAVFTPTDAELANLLEVITFDGPTAGWGYVGDAAAATAGNVVIRGRVGPTGAGGQTIEIPYKCDASLANLFGLLVARNAYTPLSAEQFTIILGADQE